MNKMMTTTLLRFERAKRVSWSIRLISSRRGAGNGNQFQLDALPFMVTPEEAYKKFESWAVNEQGLGPLLTVGAPIGSSTILPVYAPFWYFSLNIRFVESPTKNIVPEPFRSAYENSPNGIIHIPGLACYSGFSYRRSLIDPVHNTTLVFKNDSIVPFGSWMLHPIEFQGGKLDIFPDPWNATRERAFSIIYNELCDISNESNQSTHLKVEVERLSSRRIYMPTYVVEYTILGVTYRAFLSGCDSSIEVSGVSHKTMFNTGSKGDQVFQGATSFLSHKAAPMAATALQFFGLRPFIAFGQVIWGFISRIAMKFHIVGLLGGGTVMAWRKLIRPYLDDRAADAEWKQQRENEARMNSFQYIEFRDSERKAEAYFTRNRQRILRNLRGQEGRQQETEGQEWYSQWEAWAKQQWEHAQEEAFRNQQEWQRQYQEQRGRQSEQQQSYDYQQRQRQDQRQYQKTRPKEEFKWDFDPNDPYSVLGIPKTASKDDVSKAFRREMLKYHPDTSPGANDKEKRIATERSKLISNAYRKIKSSQKQ
ncbi:hypothetical protein HJC23_010921 [Cyclotella cryptica]|uniref:J domain-containing protein n=1 Tax=Cyclotella cryptica TaxID=29204 RepID=A0ABD3Q9V3_9STRA|eukprot:CCRYP_007566-RB/>CCRYP_007566-RB protein AED:0.03 eAED:0.03 QI:206/1/1/1/1/1/4/2185/535